MKRTKLYSISVFLCLLVISLPVCFAQEIYLNYDSNGNIIGGDNRFRVYNSLNQLSKTYSGNNTSGIILEEYFYDPVEERIAFKKVYNNDSSLKETVYYFAEDYVRVVNSSGSYDFEYIYQNGILIAQLNPDGSKYFIHNDAKTSSTAISNISGSLIENTLYDPRGNILSGGNISRFDYEGQEYDSVVGDYDFHFRKYLPQIGIFGQPDTLIQNVYDPQSLNRYMFERGNPLRYRDDNGHNTDDGLLEIGDSPQLGGFSLGLEISQFIGTVILSKQIHDEAEANLQKQNSNMNQLSTESQMHDINYNPTKSDIITYNLMTPNYKKTLKFETYSGEENTMHAKDYYSKVDNDFFNFHSIPSSNYGTTVPPTVKQTINLQNIAQNSQSSRSTSVSKPVTTTKANMPTVKTGVTIKVSKGFQDKMRKAGLI